MVELVVRTVQDLKQARVAVIAMSCPSEIVEPMDIYNTEDLREELMAYNPAGEMIATSEAYSLAKKLLDAETTKDKSVVVFSNGQTSTCDIPETRYGDHKAGSCPFGESKDWLVQRLNGTPATTTEAWETTKEKHGTTPEAAERTTVSQAETERAGVRELSTTAGISELEATTSTEGANLSRFNHFIAVHPR
ncbi:hypothetical protein OSTOST_21504 [Ostertagia ostertagi]